MQWFYMIDPLAEKYYSISPSVYVANNPLRYIDPTGGKIVDANGNAIYTHKGGWVANAPADAMRIGTALMATQAGTEQWNNAVNSNTNIELEISSQTIVDGNSYRMGRMIPGEGHIGSDGNYQLENAKIVIYEGTINQFMNDSKNSRDPRAVAYQKNTTTNDERIAAVAGHEIKHTDQDNLNQNYENMHKGASHNLEIAPVSVELKILHETGINRLRALPPIQPIQSSIQVPILDYE